MVHAMEERDDCVTGFEAATDVVDRRPQRRDRPVRLRRSEEDLSKCQKRNDTHRHLEVASRATGVSGM